LIRAIKGETPSLQTMFERAVLTGRVEASRILAEDSRIDVNAENEGICEGCCGNGITLVELAATMGQTATCSVLIESGKLNWHSAAMNANSVVESRVTWTRQKPSLERVSTWLPLFAMIEREGWSGDGAFCDRYSEIVCRIIASKSADFEDECRVLPNVEWLAQEGKSTCLQDSRKAIVRRRLEDIRSATRLLKTWVWSL